MAVDPYFIGTSGWTYPHWKGSFYPSSLAQARWFDYYASQFNTVEVNATFYRTFTDQTYQNWRQRAPAGFVYTLKVPRLITHEKLLLNASAEIQAFRRSTELLGDASGLVLLQISPAMPFDLPRLEKTLRELDLPGKLAVEFRREEWQAPEIREMLLKYRAIYINVDSPRTKLTGWLTAEAAYLRLHGRGQWYAYDYTNSELLEIALLARSLVVQGANRVYIYFNNDVGGYAPHNALALKNMLTG